MYQKSSFAQKVKNGEKTILYELLPLPKKLSEKDIHTSLSLFSSLLNKFLVDAINIPEVREEKRSGEREDPEITKLTPAEMSVYLKKHTAQPVVVNRGIVYESWAKQKAWLSKMRKTFGVQSIVLVGGESSKTAYPGLSVTDAAKKIQEIDPTIVLGGITIPTRQGEEKRVLQKSLAGVTFFTTQILYESKEIKRFLKAYWELCQKENVSPSMIFLSFAPAAMPADVRLLKWLGVDISSETEERITAGWLGIGARSLDICQDVLNDILSFVKKQNIRVPLGLNVEHVNRHNFEVSFSLLESLSKVYLQK